MKQKFYNFRIYLSLMTFFVITFVPVTLKYLILGDKYEYNDWKLTLLAILDYRRPND